MKTKDHSSLPRTFWWHNLTQFGGAMNDNVFKLLMLYALIAWNPESAPANILASVGLVFALPFLLIVPIAGNFADRFSKQKMIVVLKATEIAVMSFGIYALHSQNSALLYVTMFFMSAQSAFFGPCKYGIIPEQVGKDKLSKANGALQLFTFLAIIAGTVLAPELSILAEGKFSLAASACLIIAILGFATSLKIEPSPAHPTNKISFNGFRSLWKTTNYVRKDGLLTLAICALAVFSLVAAFIQLNILDYGNQHLGLSHEASTRLFLLTAIGIGIGSTFAGWLSGRTIEFGIVPIGAALMSLSLGSLALLPDGGIVAASIAMLVLGFAAGLFIVPLEAFIQYQSPKKRVGSIQAVNSFMGWLGVLTASGFLFLISSALQWSPKEGFLIISIALIGLTVFSLWILPDFLLKFLVMVFTRLCYKMEVRGLENLPTHGPALIVSNHISLMDAVLLVSSQNRRMRMLMSRRFYDNSAWLVKKVVKLSQVILIQDSDGPKQLIKSLKTARDALDEGYLVTIFAEGALSRTGMMRPFKPGFERIVKGTDYPIIPVYIGGAWGSIASYYDGMPQLRPLKDFKYPVSIHYGRPMPASSTSFEVQQAVSELSVDAFNLTKKTRKSLGHEFIESARRNWKKTAAVESSGKQIKYSELITGSLIVREAIRESAPKKESRIGILLPTGIGGAIANLAVALDNRVGVNLNYTAPSDSFRSAQEQAELSTLLTSRQFVERFPDLELKGDVIYLEDILKKASKSEKVKAAIQARFLPKQILCPQPNFSPDSIATVLFSSGSTAEPKGVMLSHHNLLSNIESFRTVLSPKRDEVILATLPLFHSFGYTATFWFPLISGLKIACHNNPLEAAKVGQLAEDTQATILLTTPSLLLAYSRKVKPEQFSNLRFVFTGAEKLQPRVADIFEKRFGIRPLEGYGATELSPVCALSLPNVKIDKLEETGNREDRLGRVLPGMAIRIVHPESGSIQAPGEEGLIHIKGANVMKGYLNRDDLTQQAIKNDWYNTGDMGVIDSDGFFAITGRLSRFCKIAGEMISLGVVEKSLQDALKLEADSLCVVTLANERKGERLYAISKPLKITATQLAETLKEISIPNLWKPNPKDWLEIDELPLLGSGKLDYREMQKIAEHDLKSKSE